MDDQTATVPLHGEAASPRDPRDPRAEALDRGATPGRYVILARIGAGGMGVVYAAYDPELDRKVALKLLRTDRFTRGMAGEADRLRLLREAQALARLTHPNVVAVHDAGTFGDRVFVAMELVEGKTLRQWLEEAPRSWREVLDHLLPAGRGLAAAHAAGLVHRDFKPENVLIGRDGRVRVVDFGLAKALADAEEPPADAGGPPESGASLATPLTEWGTVLGTPAYMAPEQLRGIAADARSDQFSFCVALYEALYGERPFAGEGPREIAEAVTRGTVREAPAGTRVPGWLREVVLRGLRADPRDRYAAMDDLLRDLGRDPAAVRRRWLAAAAIVLVTGALFSSLGYFQARRVRLCGGGEEKLDSLWNAGRKQAIHAAFLATGASFAEAAWRTVEQTLDRYTAGWAGMRREACEATRLRGEQSESLLDRRMFCLDQHLQETAAVVDLFAHADGQIVEKAVVTAARLPGIENCADVEALTSKLPPPRDPALRSRVAAARTVLAGAQALTSAGKHVDALPKARQAADLARRTGYGPLEAEALYQLGLLQDLTNDSRGAEETMFGTLVKAEEAGHQEVAAQSASQLSWIVGFKQGNAAEGHRWFRLADGIAEGARMGDGVRGDILKNFAAVLGQERHYREAADISRRALAFSERAFGRDGIPVALILTNLGQYCNQMGQQEEALRSVRRGLEIQRKKLPPDHPDFIGSYNALGNIFEYQGRLDEASDAFQRAFEISRRSYGLNHWQTAGELYNLGIVDQNRTRFPAALREYQQALAIFTASFDPGSLYVGMAQASIGEVLRLQGEPAASLASYRQALATLEKVMGPRNPGLGISLVGISRDLLKLGRAAEAIPVSERALALFESQPGNPNYLNQARFCLATVLWDGGGDRARALRLARQAREELAAAKQTDDQHEIEAWLRQRGQTW
jgi:tetratricopeptide (TPR) repeat protein/predicted Ser/Thr protein kinase